MARFTVCCSQTRAKWDDQNTRNGAARHGFCWNSFNTLRLREMGIGFAPGDPVHKIRGVGGSEFVFSKKLERISVFELELQDFDVEVSPMKYGIDMDGILGLDFLTQTRAIIDLDALTLRNSRLTDL